MKKTNQRTLSHGRAVATAALFLLALPAASGAARDLTGTWYLALDLSVVGLPPGATLPAVAIFHRDGTFNISDPGDLSSTPFLEMDTTQYGSWYRAGGGTYRATSLFLRKATDGQVEGWHRVRFTFRLTSNGNHLEGFAVEEVLECPATGGPTPFPLFNCPNPIWSEFSVIPIELPISGCRLDPRR